MANVFLGRLNHFVKFILASKMQMARCPAHMLLWLCGRTFVL